MEDTPSATRRHEGDKRPLCYPLLLPKSWTRVTNPIVARLTLQNFEILQNCAIAKDKAEKIQSLYLNDLTPKLLRLSQIQEKLRAETEKLAASYKPPGRGAVSVTLPQVMQLEEECRNYLYEAKNFLRDLLQVFNLLFGTSFEEASEWTMPKKPRPSVIEYAEANFQAQPDHIRYLKQLPACIAPFVAMRNAVEHPGGHSGMLVIQNFHFERDGTLAAPDWRRDKNGQTEYGPVSIVEDMRVTLVPGRAADARREALSVVSAAGLRVLTAAAMRLGQLTEAEIVSAAVTRLQANSEPAVLIGALEGLKLCALDRDADTFKRIADKSGIAARFYFLIGIVMLIDDEKYEGSKLEVLAKVRDEFQANRGRDFRHDLLSAIDDVLFQNILAGIHSYDFAFALLRSLAGLSYLENSVGTRRTKCHVPSLRVRKSGMTYPRCWTVC